MSHAIRRTRARARAMRSSSTADRIPDATVTAAKKPTTAHAHGVYDGGKFVSATATTATTTSAARSSTSQRPGRLSIPFLQPRERPRCALARRLVRIVEKGGHGFPFAVATHVACRQQRVETKPAAVVARHVEPGKPGAQHVGVAAQPLHQGDVRRRILGQRLAGPPLLDAPVPRADVLANVAAVDLGAEPGAIFLRRQRGRLGPVREAARGVERPRLVERASRAGVDAEPTLAAVKIERRGRLELDVRDERSEHDPGAVPARDEERVLAVEADTAPRGTLAVDVLVRIDEDAVLAAQLPAQLVELLAQLRVGVEPGVTRQPAMTRRSLRL